MRRWYVCQIAEEDNAGLGNDAGQVYLVGPFDTPEDAADYGHTYHSPGGNDDLRWNNVYLDVPDTAQEFYAVKIKKPIGQFVKGCCGT